MTGARCTNSGAISAYPVARGSDWAEVMKGVSAPSPIGGTQASRNRNSPFNIPSPIPVIRIATAPAEAVSRRLEQRRRILK